MATLRMPRSGSAVAAALLTAGLGLGAEGPTAGEGAPAQKHALDFRIVANEKDDAAAIDAARKYFREAGRDTQRKAELDERMKRGEPPAVPKPARGEVFKTKLGDYSYAWVRLSASSCGDWDASKSKNDELVAKVRKAVEGGEPVVVWPGMLIWGHATREGKAARYFVLLRNAEKGKAITGKQVASADAVASDNAGWKVNIRLTEEGGNLLKELTTKNQSTPEGLVGQLAIVMNGEVVAAPTIRSSIGRDCMISGKFSKQEAEEIVAVLRRGANPQVP